MKSWFRVYVKGAGAAEIVIYEEIGAYGISAKDFFDQLKSLGNIREILVRINSIGGDPFDALTIYNRLQDHSARVDVQIDGIAASSASIIAMAGAKVTMPTNTFFFLHDPLADVVGDADTLRKVANDLDKVGTALVKTYQVKTGKSEAEIKGWMTGDTWFTAEEARAAGLADEVIPAVEIAAKFDLSHFPNAPAALKGLPTLDAAKIYERWNRPNREFGLREKIDRALNRGGLSTPGHA